MKTTVAIDSTFEDEYGNVDVYLFDIEENRVVSSIIDECSRLTADEKYEIVCDIFNGNIRYQNGYEYLEDEIVL